MVHRHFGSDKFRDNLGSLYASSYQSASLISATGFPVPTADDTNAKVSISRFSNDRVAV